MKKVLFVATITNHIVGFHSPYLKWFKENGYEVHVASNGEMEIPYCDKHYNIPIQRSPFKTSNITAYKQLKKIIDNNQYDIIHCHTPMGGVVARMAAQKARKNKTRVIYTAHGFHFYKGAPLKNWMIYYTIEKYLSKYTDVLLTINQEDYECAKRKFKKTSVVYVPGVGVNLQKFENEISEEEIQKYRKELQLEDKDVVFICVGELNKNKNQIVLLEAIRKIANPHIKLLIAGKGGLEEYYKEKVEEYGIQENVKILGYRRDIDKLLQVANCLVSTSKREGLPVNIIEGMAAGLPIIATNIRGSRDLVKEENGFLVPVDDANILAETMKKVAQFDELSRKKMMKSSRELAQKYELKNVLEQVEKIYQNGNNCSPIRILQIVHSMNMGGAENFLMNLYRNIDKEKVQFDFLVNQDGCFDEEIEKMGGKLYQMAYITKIGQIHYEKQLIQFFKEHPEYKVIHSHIDQVSGIILQAARKAGVKVRISHSHSTKNSNGLIGKLYKKYLQSKIVKNATNYFACGEEAAKWLYQKEWKKAEIVQNGIEIEKFEYSLPKREKIRKELGIEENTVVIGHVGRFSKPKNHEFLVEVFSEYHKKNPDSVLLLAGKGVLQEKIEEKVRKMGLENAVVFLGVREDTDYLYSAFDLLVFPSLYEGLSVVLIEAQIAGLKIVASETIAKETDISNAMTFISLRETPEKWADFIRNMDMQRVECGEKAKKMYNMKEIASNMEKTYIELYTKE